MAEKILNSKEIDRIEQDIVQINENVEEYRENMATLIHSFNQEGIVQSFYEVGEFGEEQKERIMKINSAIEEFYTLITKDGGLVAKTSEYLDKARALNQTGKEG